MKFKEGDVVRVTRNLPVDPDYPEDLENGAPAYTRGMEGTIVVVDPNEAQETYDVQFFSTGETWWFGDDHLELVVHKKLKHLRSVEKRVMGEYLVAKGWRKHNRGWVEPGRDLATANTVWGTIAAFISQKGRESTCQS